MYEVSTDDLNLVQTHKLPELSIFVNSKAQQQIYIVLHVTTSNKNRKRWNYNECI